MKVIINADDFGMTREINSAICDAFENKWISSATLISGSPYVEQAVEMSSNFENISLGVHLALDSSFNLGIASNTIITNEVFRQDIVRKVKRCDLSLVGDIEDEYSRQIERIMELGVEISHVDTHHHLHLYLPVLKALIRAAKKYGIYKVRSLVLPVNQSVMKRTYRWFHHRYMRLMGMTMPDCYCKFQEFEYLPKRYLSEGSVVEIMCHPGLEGYNDEAFFNEGFFRRFKRDNIINYKDL